MARKAGGGIEVVRVGLLGRSGAGACPNLLQRHPGPGSAAKEIAEYQRFSSLAPARSGPLQQIWTNGAAAGIREGRSREGYSGVVLKAWSVKVVVMVCSGGSGAPSPLRLDSASRMVGRRLACRDEPRPASTSLNPRDRHLTREHVTLADVLAG